MSSRVLWGRLAGGLAPFMAVRMLIYMFSISMGRLLGNHADICQDVPQCVGLLVEVVGVCHIGL